MHVLECTLVGTAFVEKEASAIQFVRGKKRTLLFYCYATPGDSFRNNITKMTCLTLLYVFITKRNKKLLYLVSGLPIGRYATHLL